jgi:hypothetical protein
MIWNASGFFDLQSQHLIDVSTLPEMATDESSLNFTQFTVPRWPRYFRKDWPVDTSHRIIVLSIPQETI